jgi:hypothetical protein
MNNFEKNIAAMMSPKMTEVKIPKTNADLLEILRRSEDPAWQVFDTLVENIRAFESSLDSEHEVGAKIVSFGQSFLIHIHKIGRLSSEIITFHGIDDTGQKVQLIQNVSQLNVLLIAVRKHQEQPRRVSFQE